MIPLGFFTQDRDSCFIIRGLYVYSQAPFETADQSFFQWFQFLGRTVGRNNDLFAGFIQCVECMEEFFLCTFLFRDKLDIVDHQQVDLSVFLTEFLHFIVLDGVDQFICKSFTGYIQHFRIGVLIQNKVTDGVHQVRFTQTGVTIEIQRVIGMGRFFCDCQRCGMSHAVTVADYERVENIFGVQVTVCHIFSFFCQIQLFQTAVFLLFCCQKFNFIFFLCHQSDRSTDDRHMAFFDHFLEQGAFYLQDDLISIDPAGDDGLDPCFKTYCGSTFFDMFQSGFPDLLQFHKFSS